MFRMNGTPRAQGCAGAVPFSFARCLTQGCAGAVPFSFARCLTQGCAGAACVSFAQRITTSMGAEVAQYLTSGLAVKHPCALILDVLSRKVLK